MAEERQRTVVIVPPTRWPGFDLQSLWTERRVLAVLAQRTWKVRYRQTLVGAAWAVFQPVLLMIVFTVFFGVLGRIPSQGIPYPVFFLIGLVLWHLVAKVVAEGSASVVAHGALVKRVHFPRAYLPGAAAISGLIDLGFGLMALAVVLIAFGIVPPLTLVALPIFVLIGLSAALGVALWLSALHVTYRDVAQLLPFVTQLWFFASPILYPADIIPEPARVLYHLNPLDLVITGARWAIAQTSAPPLLAWGLGVGSAVSLLVTGYVFFRHREAHFADDL